MTILSTFHFGGKNCISVGKYVGAEFYLVSILPYVGRLLDYTDYCPNIPIFRSAFRTQSNIKDGEFCEQS